MIVKIGNQDLVVINKGTSRKEGEDRYTVVVDDESINLVDVNGTTDIGRQYAYNVVSQLAKDKGAKSVVLGSTCVVGGETELYGDDSLEAYPADTLVESMDTELADLLIKEKLATQSKEWTPSANAVEEK